MRNYFSILILSFSLGVGMQTESQERSVQEFMTRIPMIENPDDLYIDPSLQSQLGTLFPYKSNHRKNIHALILSGASKSLKIQATQWIAGRIRTDAYRVRLSRVVSEYIDETEKNLSLVFDEAESQEPILFFDEADALFGKSADGESGSKEKLIAYFNRAAERSRSVIILSCPNAANLDPAIRKKFSEVVEVK